MNNGVSEKSATRNHSHSSRDFANPFAACAFAACDFAACAFERRTTKKGESGVVPRPPEGENFGAFMFFVGLRLRSLHVRSWDWRVLSTARISLRKFLLRNFLLGSMRLSYAIMSLSAEKSWCSRDWQQWWNRGSHWERVCVFARGLYSGSSIILLAWGVLVLDFGSPLAPASRGRLLLLCHWYWGRIALIVS